MSGTKRIYRVRVTDNGGSEPRDLVPEAAEMEADTGAWNAVQFWPPRVGDTRHYLSRSGAKARVNFWAENGVAAVVEPSEPVVWPAPGLSFTEQEADRNARGGSEGLMPTIEATFVAMQDSVNRTVERIEMARRTGAVTPRPCCHTTGPHHHPACTTNRTEQQ